MAKIINAEYSRLFKSKIFRILCIVSALGGFYLELMIYLPSRHNSYTPHADTGLFAFVFFSGFIAAVFASIFTGTEYSDGTLRNKLIMGHTRARIYLTELIVNSSAMLIFFAIYLTAALALGYPLCRNFAFSGKDLAFSAGMGCLTSLAYTAIFTAFSMLWKSKAGNAVVSIVVFFALVIAASGCADRLAEPEVIPGSVYISDDGNPVYEEEEENPLYISGTTRKVVQFFYDFLPSGQGYQLSGLMDEPCAKGVFAPYSLIIFFASTALGVILFRKKDIN